MPLGESCIIATLDTAFLKFLTFFSFQELDLSAQALMGAESGREELWIQAVEQTLEKGGSYHKLLHIRLVGIMLLVYIRPHLLSSVTELDSDYITTGVGGVLVGVVMMSLRCVIGVWGVFVSRATREVWVQGSICSTRHSVSSTVTSQPPWKKWIKETM